MVQGSVLECPTHDTSIWYDTKHEAYLLPIKADLRKKLNLGEGSSIKVLVEVSEKADWSYQSTNQKRVTWDLEGLRGV